MQEILKEWKPEERLAQFDLGTPLAQIAYTPECNPRYIQIM